MANEEIEISELEYTEEVAPDNLIPIESATETKATSLQVLRNWFKSFFVSKTGDETISGLKTIDHFLLIKKSPSDFSVAQQNPIYTEIRNVDVNGFEIGQFRVWKDTDGANVIDLLGRYQHGTANVYGAHLGVKTYADGTSFAYTNAKDINNSIVTTVNKSKSANGYFKFGNGMIIQWGRYDYGTNSAGFRATITFPTAFTSTNYSFSLIGTRASNEDVTAAINCEGRAKTTTSIVMQCSRTSGSSAGIRYIDWIAIGY